MAPGSFSFCLCSKFWSKSWPVLQTASSDSQKSLIPPSVKVVISTMLTPANEKYSQGSCHCWHEQQVIVKWFCWTNMPLIFFCSSGWFFWWTPLSSAYSGLFTDSRQLQVPFYLLVFFVLVLLAQTCYCLEPSTVASKDWIVDIPNWVSCPNSTVLAVPGQPVFSPKDVILTRIILLKGGRSNTKMTYILYLLDLVWEPVEGSVHSVSFWGGVIPSTQIERKMPYPLW